MIQRAAVAALSCLVLLAHGASAHAIPCDNSAQQPSQSQTLQQILDGLVVSGPGIDASAPLNIELWTNSTAAVTVQLVVDNTSKSQSVFFGMYDPDNVGNHAFILPDGLKPSDVATVVFNDDQSISVHGPINKSYSPFEGPFGFFVKTFEGKGRHDKGKHKGWDHAWAWGASKDFAKQFLYTQDALNPNGEPHAVVFQGDGQTMLKLPGLTHAVFLPSQFLIAWETGLGDANDGQFNDYLVLVSNIVPATVPEPAFALLLGISSLALVGGRRARRALK